MSDLNPYEEGLAADLAKALAERDHLRSVMNIQSGRYWEGRCRDAEAERDALQAKCDEMAAALDSKHASVGYNIWRFWSDKSLELASKNVALQAKLADATATVELLEAQLEAVKEIYPPVPGVIRTAMEARAAKKGQTDE